MSSDAIELAREGRKMETLPDHAKLAELARDDGLRLLAELRALNDTLEAEWEGQGNEPLRELLTHVSPEEMARAIHGHALIESGHLIPVDSEEPVNPCTRCGHAFD